MIKAVDPAHIPDNIKCRLPALDLEVTRKKMCKSACPYYAGYAGGQPRCMLKSCYLGKDTEEVFHPALMEMFSYIKDPENKIEGSDPVEIRNRLFIMFFNELKEKACKQSPCQGCPYTVKDRPCVICMKKILAG